MSIDIRPSYRAVFWILLLLVFALPGTSQEVATREPRDTSRDATQRPVGQGRFTITFRGLITHVGADENLGAAVKSHAAVLAAPGHRAALRVIGSDRVPAGEDIDVRLVPGDVISFDLAPGHAHADAQFRRHIPSLSQVIADGRLLDEVQRGLPHPSVVAYVKYPRGVLGAPNTFDRPAEFRFSDGRFAAKHCVARAATFEARPTRRKVVITLRRANGITVSYEVRDEALLLLTNEPVVEGRHFHMYRSFTTADEIASVFLDEGTRCADTLTPEDSLRMPLTSTHVECGNTTWP